MATVLVAENDSDQREVLEDIIRNQGHSVVGVDNGQDATNELNKRRYDLAILDVHMPKKDGSVVMEEALRQGLNVPMILISAFASDAASRRLLLSGATLVLSKPFSLELLIESLERVLTNPPVQKLAP